MTKYFKSKHVHHPIVINAETFKTSSKYDYPKTVVIKSFKENGYLTGTVESSEYTISDLILSDDFILLDDESFTQRELQMLLEIIDSSIMSEKYRHEFDTYRSLVKKLVNKLNNNLYLTNDDKNNAKLY